RPNTAAHGDTLRQRCQRQRNSRAAPGRDRGRSATAARDGRDDGDRGAVLGLGGEALSETDIVVVHVHVHEAAQLSGVVEHPGPDAGVRTLQRVDDLGEVRALCGHLGRAAGVAAQDGRDADGDCHGSGLLLGALMRCGSVLDRSGAGSLGRPGKPADGAAPARYRPAARKAASEGLIVAVTPVSATASRVLSPSPELITTVCASGSSTPFSTSLRSTPTVTPPAVSVNVPSVRASSLMAETICASSTSSIAPPVRRAMSST